MVLFLRFLVWLFSFLFRPFNHKWVKGEPIKCLVVGYGGANNTGAEARTVEAIKQILDVDPRIKITLTSLDSRQTLRYLTEGDRLEVAQINPVFIFCMLRLVLKSDLVILVEGSCFKDNFSSVLLWFFLYTAGLAQKLKKTTVVYAVDAGKMKPANIKWSRAIADKMDLLMTRTQVAADLLREIGVKKEVKVTTDTAFTQKPAGDKWVEECFKAKGVDTRWPIAGIAFEELFWWPVEVNLWRAIRFVKEDHYKSIYYHSWGKKEKNESQKMKETIAKYADWVSDEFGAQVVFFAMERLDAKPCQDVAALMKHKSVIFGADHYNAAQMTAILQHLSWLVTCRYHALVMSMGGAIPVIGLAHDERIESIMSELGFKDDFFIHYKESDLLTKLINMTHKLISQKDQLSKKIREIVPSYLKRMNLNSMYLKDLILLKFPT